MSEIINVTDSDFETQINQTEKLVLIDFWAEWCGPCKQIAPILDEIAKEMGEQVVIMKMNIDENPKTPTNFGVRSIPTMILFQSGKNVATKVGASSKTNLVEWINSTL